MLKSTYKSQSTMDKVNIKFEAWNKDAKPTVGQSINFTKCLFTELM